jgi:dipeptidyl aminopeptidase/acylaminoacyl peptidase
VLDLRSLELRRLAEQAADPAFSPDGTQIAYASDRDENGELSYGDTVSYATELYVMDADGSDNRRLTHTPDLNERAPSWSPDGRLIAYERGQVVDNAQGSMVLTVRPDGSCPRVVAFDPALRIDYRDPAWRPGRALGDTQLECLSAPTRPALVPLPGNMSIAQARRFHDFALDWVGRRFEGLALKSISRMPVYGPGGAGDAVFLEYGAFQIQLWPACVRVPTGVYDRLERRIRLRGVDGYLFQGGRRLELVTRRTTIVVFGEREQIVRVVRALRPLNPAFFPSPGERLAPPTPGALTSDLDCGW